jgi:hypothetical protein
MHYDTHRIAMTKAKTGTFSTNVPTGTFLHKGV